MREHGWIAQFQVDVWHFPNVCHPFMTLMKIKSFSCETFCTSTRSEKEANGISKVELNSAYEPKGPSGWRLSRFLCHEATSDYNNSYKLYCNNCIDDKIQTTTCLGNNISAKTIPPACSIHERPRINIIAPRYQFQRIQISAELKQWLLTTIRHYSYYSPRSPLFAIHYSDFSDTQRLGVFPG